MFLFRLGPDQQYRAPALYLDRGPLSPPTPIGKRGKEERGKRGGVKKGKRGRAGGTLCRPADRAASQCPFPGVASWGGGEKGGEKGREGKGKRERKRQGTRNA